MTRWRGSRAPREGAPPGNRPAHVLRRIEGGGKPPSFGKHMKMLDAIPVEQRDLDWSRAVALLTAIHQRNERICLRELGVLRRSAIENGSPDEFDTFLARLNHMIHPRTVSFHGYVVPFAERDRSAVVAEAAAVVARLGALGYDAFINSGTLLGAVRDGKLIAHDDDVDLAVIVPATSAAEAASEWIRLAQRLLAEGLIDAGHHARSGHPLFKLDNGSGVDFDLFPAWFSAEGRCHVWPHTCGELVADEVLPLVPIALHGCLLPAPRQPEKMLALNYGPGWRQPDPSFVFPSKQARRRFSALLSAYRRARTG